MDVSLFFRFYYTPVFYSQTGKYTPTCAKKDTHNAVTVAISPMAYLLNINDCVNTSITIKINFMKQYFFKIALVTIAAGFINNASAQLLNTGTTVSTAINATTSATRSAGSATTSATLGVSNATNSATAATAGISTATNTATNASTNAANTAANASTNAANVSIKARGEKKMQAMQQQTALEM